MYKQEPKSWTSTMDPDEVRWCIREIDLMVDKYDENCVDNYRAARMWVSSQRRRYRRDKANGCCGYADWIATRWNWRKFRFDIYMLGFNYGH